MKIGILTQPLGHNYGGILQNWALQQVLSSLGHTPVTIRHYGLSASRQFLADTRCVVAWAGKCIIRHKTRNVYVLPWQRRTNRRLKKFVRKQIILTPLISALNENSLAKIGLDAIVVGSDQTWRPKYNAGHLFDMFCCFLDETSSIPRIAYAASFGVENWEFDGLQTEMAKKGVSRFSAVSLRETSGVGLCKTYLDVDAVQVLDPTLLLGSEQYNKLISKKEYGKVSAGQIGVYILDETDEKRRLVEQVCRVLGKEANWFGRKDQKGVRQSVEYWLASFDKSDFIVTDSFHGTAFSINYHRPFLTILNSDRGIDRFASLLNIFGLNDRAIAPSDSEKVNSIIRQPIDWLEIDAVLNRERNRSQQFIINNLK